MLDGIVFSSEYGKMCPVCKRPIKECKCLNSNGIVRVSRETKGRKGKGVTIITGVPLHDEDILKLGKELKQKCGAGGTVKNGIIEIQGDHRDKIVQELQNMGWTIKRSGG